MLTTALIFANIYVVNNSIDRVNFFITKLYPNSVIAVIKLVVE